MVRLRVEVVMLEVEMVLMVEVMLVGEFVTIKGMVLVLVVVMVEVVVMLEVEMEQMAVVVLVLVLAVMAADRSRWCWRRVGLSASYPADLCGDQVDGVELPLLGAESQGILPGAEAQRGHLLLLGSAGLVGARVGGDLGPEEPPVSISSSTQVDRTRAERPCYCNIKVILSRVPC